ncbi:glyoxalase superfamily protein [Paenibacillus sp. GCM10023252]|uniref:glyoxalase superfamily protein n=1 Tax=Paenibacillus sp. GCM10023252 TaxID=3252649 RepID=UPI00360CD204
MTIVRGVTPILRMFDESRAKEFYIRFLGFTIDWEHRFEPGMPLYMQIRLGEACLHLSEHHGDATPGGAVRIEVQGIGEMHEQLLSKNYKYARPGLESTPWNTQEILVQDPFGNRIIFYEHVGGVG